MNIYFQRIHVNHKSLNEQTKLSKYRFTNTSRYSWTYKVHEHKFTNWTVLEHNTLLLAQLEHRRTSEQNDGWRKTETDEQNSSPVSRALWLWVDDQFKSAPGEKLTGALSGLTDEARLCINFQFVANHVWVIKLSSVSFFVNSGMWK